jgi:3-oxoadipate enol-lactonase
MKINVNGININYELSAPESAPVVMLSHSLAASLAMWAPQIATLSARYRVLRYDLRGHGLSEAPKGPYTFDNLADDALGLLRALNIKRCHFVGLSIGGMIGQALGLRPAPEIASLTLCATSSRMPAEMQSVWDTRIAQVRAQGVGSIASGTMERWFTAPFHASHATTIAEVGAMIAGTSAEGFAGCASAIKTLNFTDQLKKISLPTLLIVGRDDPGTPVAASEAIQREIKGAELVVLENAMHICNIEQAEAFNNALLGFLQRQP